LIATQNTTRYFCSVCGTHVFTSDVRFPKVAGVPAGVIHGELPSAPEGHSFVSHKAAWHAIGDSLPQFGGESGFEPVAHNPSYMDAPDQQETDTATTRYDVAEHLRTPEEMAAYLEACIEEANGDAAFIAKALGDIARAKGMTQVARDAGLSRESLYKALSGERAPGFDTILKVIGALGLWLHAEAVHH